MTHARQDRQDRPELTTRLQRGLYRECVHGAGQSVESPRDRRLSSYLGRCVGC
jgi:hypothetical protein